MLKSVLYLLLVATTAIRFTDLVFLIQSGTNLPAPVLAAAGFMVAYGLVLVLKKLIGSLRIKQLMYFYLIQAVLVVFNLSYTAITYPLQLSVFELVAVGSFLDILVDASVVYYCLRRMRSTFIPAVANAMEQKAVREGSNV